MLTLNGRIRKVAGIDKVEISLHGRTVIVDKDEIQDGIIRLSIGRVKVKLITGCRMFNTPSDFVKSSTGRVIRGGIVVNKRLYNLGRQFKEANKITF